MVTATATVERRAPEGRLQLAEKCPWQRPGWRRWRRVSRHQMERPLHQTEWRRPRRPRSAREAASWAKQPYGRRRTTGTTTERECEPAPRRATETQRVAKRATAGPVGRLRPLGCFDRWPNVAQVSAAAGMVTAMRLMTAGQTAATDRERKFATRKSTTWSGIRSEESAARSASEAALWASEAALWASEAALRASAD